MEIRPTTRAAFAALRTAGAVPSVRQIHARVGGSYNRLTAEMRALRAEHADGRAALVAAAQAPVVLRVTPRAAAALARLRQALREQPRLYHDCELFLWKLQRTKQGPLTEALKALVGKET
jgi:hypothetical protein